MSTQAFDCVAAQIATLSEHAANASAGRVLRLMAARHRGSEVVAFMIILSHVLRARGAAVVPIERLADEAGLTIRALTSALAALERGAVALVQKLDRATVRVTLPGLLADVDVGAPGGRKPARRFAPEMRVLH